VRSLSRHPRPARLGLPALLAALALLALPAVAPAQAQEREELTLAAGVTLLELDAGTAGVLTENGVTVTTLGAAESSEDIEGIPTFSFPITYGFLDPETLAGLIVHRGGLELAAGDVSVRVRNFVIDTEEQQLTARVSGIRGRVPLLDLDLSAVAPLIERDFVLLNRVGATLTEEAAGALNAAFSVELFTAGLPIGTAQVFGVTG
jgi:hypothetical protein